MNEYVAMWKNYVNFKDRTTVRGFWMAILFNFIASIVLSIIGMIIKTDILSTIYSFAVCIPAIAMGVRRLNDSGKDWKWIFINFVPLIGSIWYLVLCCKASIPDNGVAVV